MQSKPTVGFTLIELLIVVAIIAILAAIAVPNFLEAQTRAKVSRAKSDLRTAQTALESYFVDNNKYPYVQVIGGSPWLLPSGFPRNQTTERPGGLTTPIAYLTSVPIDVFTHFIDGTTEEAPIYFERAGFGYRNGARQAGGMSIPVPATADGPGKIAEFSTPDRLENDPNKTPAQYVLWSAGPNKGPHVTDANGGIISRSRYNLNNRYDPTNGTISGGNVLRLPGGRNFPD